MPTQKIVRFAKAAIAEDFANDFKHFTLPQLMGFLHLVASKHIKASSLLKSYAKNMIQHDDIVHILPVHGDITLTDFISAMLYVNSQARSKTERWSLSNLPTSVSKQLAANLVKMFKEDKEPLAWMG